MPMYFYVEICRITAICVKRFRLTIMELFATIKLQQTIFTKLFVALLTLDIKNISVKE